MSRGDHSSEYYSSLKYLLEFAENEVLCNNQVLEDLRVCFLPDGNGPTAISKSCDHNVNLSFRRTYMDASTNTDDELQSYVMEKRIRTAYTIPITISANQNNLSTNSELNQSVDSKSSDIIPLSNSHCNKAVITNDEMEFERIKDYDVTTSHEIAHTLVVEFSDHIINQSSIYPNPDESILDVSENHYLMSPAGNILDLSYHSVKQSKMNNFFKAHDNNSSIHMNESLITGANESIVHHEKFSDVPISNFLYDTTTPGSQQSPLEDMINKSQLSRNNSKNLNVDDIDRLVKLHNTPYAKGTSSQGTCIIDNNVLSNDADSMTMNGSVAESSSIKENLKTINIDVKDPLLFQQWPCGIWERVYIPKPLNSPDIITRSLQQENACIVYWIRNTLRTEHNLGLNIATMLANSLRIPLIAIAFMDSRVHNDIMSEGGEGLPNQRDNQYRKIPSRKSFLRKSFSHLNALKLVKKSLDNLNIPLLILSPSISYTKSSRTCDHINDIIDCMKELMIHMASIVTIITDDVIHPLQENIFHRIINLEEAKSISFFAFDSNSICIPRRFRDTITTTGITTTTGSNILQRLVCCDEIFQQTFLRQFQTVLRQDYDYFNSCSQPIESVIQASLYEGSDDKLLKLEGRFKSSKAYIVHWNILMDAYDRYYDNRNNSNHNHYDRHEPMVDEFIRHHIRGHNFSDDMILVMKEYFINESLHRLFHNIAEGSLTHDSLYHQLIMDWFLDILSCTGIISLRQLLLSYFQSLLLTTDFESLLNTNHTRECVTDETLFIGTRILKYCVELEYCYNQMYQSIIPMIQSCIDSYDPMYPKDPNVNILSSRMNGDINWFDMLSITCLESIDTFERTMQEKLNGYSHHNHLNNTMTSYQYLHPSQLRNASTTNLLFNSIQQMFIIYGFLPSGIMLKYWLCFLLIMVSNIENGIKIACLEIATHNRSHFDYNSISLVQIMKYAEIIVVELIDFVQNWSSKDDITDCNRMRLRIMICGDYLNTIGASVRRSVSCDDLDKFIIKRI